MYKLEFNKRNCFHVNTSWETLNQSHWQKSFMSACTNMHVP
uniref:Uncharacterized protein n=1 Tax=Rhizophora mucronata TaxID=61149 RepID=A0A2P2P3T8_RHIMU